MSDAKTNGVALRDIEEIRDSIHRGDIEQAELADRAGIARSTLHTILKAEEPDPRLSTAEPLVKAFRALLAERAASTEKAAAVEEVAS